MKFIKVQPFGVHCTILAGAKQVKKFFHGEVPDEMRNAAGYCLALQMEEGIGFVMCLPVEYDDHITMHECLHLGHMVMDYVGIEIGSDVSSMELQAYLQGHIVEEVKRVAYKIKPPKPVEKEAECANDGVMSKVLLIQNSAK